MLINIAAIIAGMIFESKRLFGSWSKLLKLATWAFVFTLFIMLFSNVWDQAFEDAIEFFSYFFIFSFVSFALVAHGKKIRPKLAEGVTLLQSMAVMYWFIDYGFLTTSNLLLKILMFIALLFALYSIFHAFTTTVLSQNSRLILSVWSSIIMVIFALDYILRLLENQQIASTVDFASGLYVGLQFFLLGVSSIYIVQNVLMLSEFFPSTGRFLNATYFREVKELKKEHIERYSEAQASIPHAVFCAIFTALVFGLNYHYQIAPRSLAIWLVFFSFPLILNLYDFFTSKKFKS